jgi:hypothetical protein
VRHLLIAALVGAALAAISACTSSTSSSSANNGACIGYVCNQGNDGTPYCNCTLGLGTSGGGSCSGPQFGSSGNCCFHPDTASCRCDGNPGCGNGGTVVQSCSQSMAQVQVACTSATGSTGPYCNCALTLSGGGGGSCDGAQFGSKGNCCLHPDTLSCRCDGNPGCSGGGTVVESCSTALAVSAQPESPCH